MVVAIITARANSKGLPGKNMLELAGKPLIQYTYESVLNSKAFDRIILSTDLLSAIDLAGSFPGIEVPFIRPEHLCGDKVSQLDVVNHVVDFLDDESYPISHFVLFQPTAPFRKVKELKEGVLLLKEGADSVIGVTPVMHHPADYLIRGVNNKIEYLLPEYTAKPRQAFPEVYFNNGAFYGVEIGFFKEKQVFYNQDSVMLLMNEYSAIDIDTQLDFSIANALISGFNNAI